MQMLTNNALYIRLKGNIIKKKERRCSVLRDTVALLKNILKYQKRLGRTKFKLCCYIEKLLIFGVKKEMTYFLKICVDVERYPGLHVR